MIFSAKMGRRTITFRIPHTPKKPGKRLLSAKLTFFDEKNHQNSKGRPSCFNFFVQLIRHMFDRLVDAPVHTP